MGFRGGFAGKFEKTVGTNEPVVMLGHAFAAKKTFAFQAAGDRLPLGMVFAFLKGNFHIIYSNPQTLFTTKFFLFFPIKN
jgi:hypothetical protein